MKAQGSILVKNVFFSFTFTIYFILIFYRPKNTEFSLDYLECHLNQIVPTQSVENFNAFRQVTSSYQIISLMFPAGVCTSNRNWTDWTSGRPFRVKATQFSTLDSRCAQNCTKYNRNSSWVLKSSHASKFSSIHLYQNFLDLFAYFKPQTSTKHLLGFIVHYCSEKKNNKKKQLTVPHIFCCRPGIRACTCTPPHTQTHTPTVAAAAGCNTSLV